jgi:plastocyanin
MFRTLTRAAATATLIALPLVACGGGSSTGGSVAGADLTVHAQDSLKFDKSSYTAKAGDLTIGYTDDGSLVHTLLIKEKPDFKLQVTSKGDSKSAKASLAAGTYTLFCDVPGHEAGGMKATLNVS